MSPTALSLTKKAAHTASTQLSPLIIPPLSVADGHLYFFTSTEPNNIKKVKGKKEERKDK